MYGRSVLAKMISSNIEMDNSYQLILIVNIDIGIWFVIIVWGHFSSDHIRGNGIPLCKAAILDALNKARDWQKEIYSNILESVRTSSTNIRLVFHKSIYHGNMFMH